MDNLRKKLADLIGFLQEIKENFWCSILQNIEYKLNKDSLVEIGLYDLRRVFGGVGSLNDLYVCEMRWTSSKRTFRKP